MANRARWQRVCTLTDTALSSRMVLLPAGVRCANPDALLAADTVRPGVVQECDTGATLGAVLPLTAAVYAVEVRRNATGAVEAVRIVQVREVKP